MLQDRLASPQERHCQLRHSKRCFRRPAVLQMPRCGQARPCGNPRQQAFWLKARRFGHDFNLTLKTSGLCGCTMIWIAEQVGEIESAFADQPFGIYGQPAALTCIQNVVMMHIAVQSNNILRCGEQIPRHSRSFSEKATPCFPGRKKRRKPLRQGYELRKRRNRLFRPLRVELRGYVTNNAACLVILPCSGHFSQ